MYIYIVTVLHRLTWMDFKVLHRLMWMVFEIECAKFTLYATMH